MVEGPPAGGCQPGVGHGRDDHDPSCEAGVLRLWQARTGIGTCGEERRESHEEDSEGMPPSENNSNTSRALVPEEPSLEERRVEGYLCGGGILGLA